MHLHLPLNYELWKYDCGSPHSASGFPLDESRIGYPHIADRARAGKRLQGMGSSYAQGHGVVVDAVLLKIRKLGPEDSLPRQWTRGYRKTETGHIEEHHQSRSHTRISSSP